MVKRNSVFGVVLHSQLECDFLAISLLLFLEVLLEDILADGEFKVAKGSALIIPEVAVGNQLRHFPFAPQGSPVVAWHLDLNLFVVLVCTSTLSFKLLFSVDNSGNED